MNSNLCLLNNEVCMLVFTIVFHIPNGNKYYQEIGIKANLERGTLNFKYCLPTEKISGSKDMNCQSQGVTISIRTTQVSNPTRTITILEQLERLGSEDTPAASNFWILKQPLHATHLLKLLDKMCKYEMDPMSTVEDTERTGFCPQTDRRTRWNQYTPLSTKLKREV